MSYNPTYLPALLAKLEQDRQREAQLAVASGALQALKASAAGFLKTEPDRFTAAEKKLPAYREHIAFLQQLAS